MSYLALPRLHFLGRMAVSTPTANNNNYDLVLDVENAAIHDPYRSMTDQGFRDCMRSLVLKDLSMMSMGIVDVLNANWDYDGDNSLWFENVVVTGADLPNGQRVRTAAEDPVVGLPVTILGDKWGDHFRPALIVDNDPTSDLSSQIFYSQFQVGAQATGLTAAASPEAGWMPRAYERWLYLARNLMVFPDACFSAIWQLPLPNRNLRFQGTDTSPAIRALAAAAASGLGLQARFVTYYFERKWTDEEMQQFYKNGATPKNRSRGVILGTIGAWDETDLGSAPAGRILYPPLAPMPYPNAVMAMNKAFTLGPAVARVDPTRHVVTLDLCTAFPEVTAAKDPADPDPHELQKIDLSVAMLEVLSADGKTTTPIGTFPYDTTSYLAGSGLVEVGYAADQQAAIDAGTLRISCASAAVSPVLLEQPYTAETDDRSTYLTVGESTSIRVRIYERGGAPTKRVPVGVQQYRAKEILGPPGPTGTSGLPEKHFILAPNGVTPFVSIDPPGGAIVDTDGWLTLTLTGLEPGLGMLRFLVGAASDNFPAPANDQDQGAWMRLSHCHVRVLPADTDLDAIPDDQVTWELVYDKVLRYFYRMYPAMDGPMKLNDQATVEARAQMLQLMIDENSWGSTLYMPITRELSKGKRRLLQRWCARVLSGVST
jgi:hypothetical protein